ncbi:MAG: macro domain-containing protein [Pirellulales bacterium]|nr:macro domain-containing protein [Pirellulales bacterium]
MRVSVAGQTLELTQGDITQQAVDAIVNAANSQLAGGGGVDGAIHRRGGPGIMAETARRYPDGCPIGSAVISGGGLLTAKFVIHAVAPRWRGGTSNEASLLASAYQSSLQLAVEHQCTSIALPSLGTGAYGYPLDRASQVALGAAIDFLRSQRAPALVRFVLFDGGAYGAFAATLEELTLGSS